MMPRVLRRLRPQFQCTLITRQDSAYVEERLRANISGAWFFRSGDLPLLGKLTPPHFKVDVNTFDDRASTNFFGVLERAEDGTRIRAHAQPGELGILIPLFGLGFMSWVFFVKRFPDQPWWFAAIGLVALTIVYLVRLYEVQTFWRDVNNIVETLEYILEAEVVSRSHDLSGREIEEGGTDPRP